MSAAAVTTRIDLLAWHNSETAFAPLATCIAFTVLNATLLVLFVRFRDLEPLRQRPIKLMLVPMLFNNLAYFLYSLAIYLLWGLGAAEHACDLVFFPLGVYAILSFVPYTIAGAQLYVQFTSGVVLLADSKLDNDKDGVLPSPSAVLLLRVKRVIMNQLQWVRKPWAPALILVLHLAVVLGACGAVYGLHAVDSTDPLWCNTIDFAWVLLAQSIELMVFGAALVLLLYTVDDMYAMRNEGTAVLLHGAVLGPFLYLTMFDIVRMPFIYCIMIGSWFCCGTSLVYPLIQTILTMRARQQLMRDGRSSTATTEPGEHDELFGEAQLHKSLSADVPLSTLSPNDGSSMSSPLPRQHKRGTPRLDRLLQNDATYDRLLKLAVKCFAVELIMFCRDLLRFRAMYQDDTFTDADRLERFHHLLNTYIAEQSPREINIYFNTRKAVMDRALASPADDAKSVATAFDEVDTEVREMIKYNILPLWRESMLQLQQ